MARRLRTVWCAALLALVPLAARGQDTLVVHADGPPAWGADLRLVKEVRIGSISGAETESFGWIVGVVVGPHGEVAIGDSQVPIIRVFDASGRYVRDLGHRGQGPGEYRQLLGMRATPDGDVAVWDPGNQRITSFAFDGASLGSIPAHSGLFTGDPFQVDTAGFFYVKSLPPGTPRAIGRESPTVWIRIDASGRVLDTIPVPLSRHRGSGFALTTPAGMRRPFSAQTISTFSPHGYMVVGHSTAYALSRPLPDGRVLRIERTARAVDVGRGEGAQWQEILDRVASTGMAAGASFAPVPKRKPVFREVWIDDEGRLWVSRYVGAVFVEASPEEKATRASRPVLEWHEPPTWDILDPRGAYLGTVVAPMRSRIVAARGRTVWMLEQGEFGEQYVTRYRIVAGG